MTRIDLKIETETLIQATQEQALKFNYMNSRFDKTMESDKFRICAERYKLHGKLLANSRNFQSANKKTL